MLSLGIGALGIVFAATAASLIAPDEVENWVGRLHRLVTTTPQRRIWRLARAAALIGLSVFVILKPTYAIQVAVVITGGCVLFFGVGEALQVLPPPRRGGLGSRDFDLLMRRARRCRDERSLVPNVVAVDFYDEGDLLEAVNVLNGLPRR